MDISSTSSVSSATSALAQAKTGDAVGISMLKKALDIQAQSAVQLIDAAAQAGKSNPPHLGQQVDVVS